MIAAFSALVVGGAFAAIDRFSPKEMAFVPAGNATLGYVSYMGLYGPMPYFVGDFWIDKFEVTNAAYAAFVTATDHAPAAFVDEDDLNQSDQPVTGVLHADATAYCGWRGKRLPTESEWEKAARGVDGQIYPWGNQADLSRAHISGEAPVAVTKHAGDISPYGVFGLAGNVSEWVSDTRQARAGQCRDSAVDTRDATPEMRELLAQLKADNGGVLPAFCTTPEALDQSVPSEPCAYIKGNSWNGRDHMTVASNRMWDYTNSYAEFVGFRCAKGN